MSNKSENDGEPKSLEGTKGQDEDEISKGGIKARLKDFRGKLSGTFSSVTEDYTRSEAKRRLDQLSEETKRFLDEKGITEEVLKAYGFMQEHLDTVAGTRILRLVEERLELQEKYNDILATKLREALQRIEVLESKLKG